MIIETIIDIKFNLPEEYDALINFKIKNPICSDYWNEIIEDSCKAIFRHKEYKKYNLKEE